jgi:hypothetical protein
VSSPARVAPASQAGGGGARFLLPAHRTFTDGAGLRRNIDAAMTVGTESVDLLMHAIELRTDAGESLEMIDAEVVRAAPVDEDCRSALWLYAWSRLEAPGGRPTGPAVIGG